MSLRNATRQFEMIAWMLAQGRINTRPVTKRAKPRKTK